MMTKETKNNQDNGLTLEDIKRRVDEIAKESEEAASFAVVYEGDKFYVEFDYGAKEKR